jgi:hypothetical protein
MLIWVRLPLLKCFFGVETKTLLIWKLDYSSFILMSYIFGSLFENWSWEWPQLSPSGLFSIWPIPLNLVCFYTEKNFFFNLNQISKMENYIWFKLTHIFHCSKSFSMECYHIWLWLNNMSWLSWFNPYFDVFIFSILLIWFKLKKKFFSV